MDPGLNIDITPALRKYLTPDELKAHEEDMKAREAASAAEAAAPTPPPQADVTLNVNLPPDQVAAKPYVLGQETQHQTGFAIEAARAIAGGVFGGINEAKNTLVDAAEAVTGAVGIDTAAGAKNLRENWSLPKVVENQSTVGTIARALVKFGGAAVGGAKLVKGGTAVALGAGAATDFLVASPDDGMLADLVSENPTLGPLVKMAGIATDPTDSRYIAKMKVAAEGIVIGGLVNVAVHAIAGKVKAGKLRAAGDVEGAAKVEAQTAKKVDEAMAEAAASPDVSKTAEQLAEPVTVYRQSTPENMKTGEALNFSASQETADGFQHKGSMLHSQEIPAGELEKYRKSNILADPNADPALKERILKEGGDPSKEFLVPAEVAAKAKEHYGPGGLGDPAAEAAAAARTADAQIADTSKLREGELPNVAKPAVKLSDAEAGIINELISDPHTGMRPLAEQYMPGGNQRFNTRTWNTAEDLKANFDATVLMARDKLSNMNPNDVISHASVVEDAKVFGTDAAHLVSWASREAATNQDKVARFIAAKDLVISMTKDVFADVRLMNAGLLDIGADRAAAELRVKGKMELLLNFANDVAGIQTTGARMTSAGQIKLSGGILLDDLNRLVMTNGDPEALIKTLRSNSVKKWLGVHNFYWINAVLSGPVTQFVNVVGNAFMTAFTPAARIAGGMLTANRGEISAGVRQYSALRSASSDAMEFAWKALKDNAQVLDPGNAIDELARNPIQAANFEIPKWIEKLEAASGTPDAFARGIDYLGQIVGAPTRLLSATDEFFKQINYRSRIIADAHVQGFERGLSGATLAKHVQDTLDNSVNSAGKAINDKVFAQTSEQTFTNSMKVATWGDMKSFGSILNDAGTSNPVIKTTILPFVKVPVNLARTARDMTPLGLFAKKFWSEVSGPAADETTRALALGKMGLGTLMGATTVMLASEGYVTGGAPADKDLRATKMDSKWQPYSYVITHEDGTKTYVPFGRLDPVGMVLGIAADMVQVSGKVDQGIYDNVVTAMAGSLASNMVSKTYLRSLVEAVQAVQKGADGGKSFTWWAANRVGSYVPSIVGLAQPDDSLKYTRGLLDAAMAKVPGLSDQIEARRDNFGEKIMPAQGYPFNKLNPFAWSTADDKVRMEMARLADSAAEVRFPVPNEKLNGRIDLTSIKNEKGQSAYDRYMELHGEIKLNGRTMHDAMERMIESPAYQKAVTAMGDGSHVYRSNQPHMLLQNIISTYRTAALNKVTNEIPALKKARLDDLKNSRTAPYKGPASILDNPALTGQ